MITGRQVRAARALLNWKQDMLAEKALVALTALKRLESERGLPVHDTTRDQVRRALEAAGIMFVESDRGNRCDAAQRGGLACSLWTSPLKTVIADANPTP